MQKSEVIRAYKIQCTSISTGINGIIKRGINENVPLIIEGVHLIPGRLRDSGILDSYEDNITEYLIYISNPEIHKQRFIQRQKEAPERRLDKYLNNFKEIRWIHDYLVERARRYDQIKIIDNSQSLQEGIEKIFDAYK